MQKDVPAKPVPRTTQSYYGKNSPKPKNSPGRKARDETNYSEPIAKSQSWAERLKQGTPDPLTTVQGKHFDATVLPWKEWIDAGET